MLDESLPLGARIGNALVSYCRYLGKLAWPANLTVFYPHPGQWPVGEVLLAGGLLLGLTTLAWAGRRRHPHLLLGWLWYCGTLVPVSQVIQTGGHAMADRYTYLPLLGLFVAVVWGAGEATRGWRYRAPALAAAGGAVLALCLALTREQLGYWLDSESLFRHALEVTADNYLAHNNLGAALARKGQTDAAIPQYHEALRLKPDYADACYNLGAALAAKGQIADAMGQFREAIRFNPGYADAHNNLGAALVTEGQIDAGIADYQETLRLKPDHVEAHYNLGAALEAKGQIGEAIAQFQEALRLNPGYAEAHYNLGILFLKTRQNAEAVAQLHEALRLKPDYAEARKQLARLGVEYAKAVVARGGALAGQGKYAEAIQFYQYRLEIPARPDRRLEQPGLAAGRLSRRGVS